MIITTIIIPTIQALSCCCMCSHKFIREQEPPECPYLHSYVLSCLSLLIPMQNHPAELLHPSCYPKNVAGCRAIWHPSTHMHLVFLFPRSSLLPIPKPFGNQRCDDWVVWGWGSRTSSISATKSSSAELLLDILPEQIKYLSPYKLQLIFLHL